MSRIVVTQPVHPEVLQRLRAHGEVVMNPGPEPWPEPERLAHLRTAHAMMAFMPDAVDRPLLAAAPQLRTIAGALKGFDNFDLPACAEAGVVVTYVPDLLSQPTAELAIGLAIGVARHVRLGDNIVRAGRFAGWRPTLYGTGLQGSTVAVVGLGAVGRAILERLEGFGCARLLGVDPVAHDPRVQKVPLGDAVAQADYLMIATPLTAESRHLIDSRMLKRAPRHQVIVNVGRGSVVDEEAVAQALEQDLIGAYAADVFEFEDWLLLDRPQAVSQRLRQHPRTLFTPHLGSAVARVRLGIEHRAADNLIAVLSGRIPKDAIVPGQDGVPPSVP